MTISTTNPTDQALIAELPSYIRETRTYLNQLESLKVSITATEINILAGTTAFTVGAELSDEKIELVYMHCVGGATIQQIAMGYEGQIKVFLPFDANVSFLDGVADDSGNIYLNQLPPLSTWNLQPGDIVALINIGGDGTTSHYGYWKELWRNESVK